MLTLLYISIPFALVTAALFGMSQLVRGWEGLSWAIYAATAAAAWAGVVLLYFIWLMLRDGVFAFHGIPLAAIAVAAAAAATWGVGTWTEHARCKADGAFYERLAATPMADRAALLAARQGAPAEPTPCGRDAISLHFVNDKHEPLPPDSHEARERAATLRLLFEQGLPPDDRFFHEAVGSADPAFVRLLVERREALASAGESGWDPVPLARAEQALGQIEMDPQSVYHAYSARYLEIVSTFIEHGLDICQPISATWTYRDELERKRVPREIWAGADTC